MNDRRRDFRSGHPVELNSRRHLPGDMPLHSRVATGWTQPESSPYYSSALLGRQRWRYPTADAMMDFEKQLSESPLRVPSPTSEWRTPFGSTVLGDGGSNRQGPYPDDCDELSLESYDYRSSRREDSERFSASSHRARQPQSTPPFHPDRGRSFGCGDRSRPFFGPSRPHPQREPFNIPGDLGEPHFAPCSPYGGPPRFSVETEQEAPPGTQSMQRGGGGRGNLQSSNRRWTPPNAGTWLPPPFGFEHYPGTDEYGPPSGQFLGGRRESWHPNRRGPKQEALQNTAEGRSPPLRFPQRAQGCLDFDQHTPDSRKHRDWNLRQRATSNYGEQPVPHSDYNHWDSCPRGLQDHGQEHPDVPYYNEHPLSFSGIRAGPFHPGHFEGNSQGRPVSAGEEPLPAMRGPRQPYITRTVSQNSSHVSHLGSSHEDRQLPDRYGSCAALSKVETKGDGGQLAAPGCQAGAQTPLHPSLPNLPGSHKEETVVRQREEVPPNFDNSGCPWNSGDADPRNSGARERAVDVGCPWPILPTLGGDRAVKTYRMRGPVNTECNAAMPIGLRAIEVSSQSTANTPVQLASPGIAVRPPLGPSTAPQSRSEGQPEPDDHQRLPVPVRQQPCLAQTLLPSASPDQIWPRPQSVSLVGNIPLSPVQSWPQNLLPTCLDSVEQRLGLMVAGGFKEEKLAILSDSKLQPPPSPPWLRGSNELGYQGLPPSFQEQVAQLSETVGLQRKMVSEDRDKKPSACPIEQQHPQVSSKASSGPRQSYRPDIPKSGQQPSSCYILPRVPSPPTVSSLSGAPFPSPTSNCVAPKRMMTTSANVTPLISSVAAPVKSQEPPSVTAASPKVRFSLPSPLLSQGQARFSVSANHEGARACAQLVSLSQAKPVISEEAEQPTVPQVESKPEDKPSPDNTKLRPPPDTPAFLAGSPQVPGPATSMQQPSLTSMRLQGQQSATSVSHEQRSLAPDGHSKVAYASTCSKLGGNVGRLKKRKTKSPCELYDPKVPNPTFAVQSPSTDAHSCSSRVEGMEVDADDPGIPMQQDKTRASVVQTTLPVAMPETRPPLRVVNKGVATKKALIKGQNTVLLNKNLGLKKLQPLIMKKVAALKKLESEMQKQDAALESEDSLSKSDSDTADTANSSEGHGSGIKNIEEAMEGSQAISVTKEESTSIVKQETLNTEEITQNINKAMEADENRAVTDKEAPSDNGASVNDQEVSSSTPECCDEIPLVAVGKGAEISKDPNTNSRVAVNSEDNCNPKKPPQGSPTRKSESSSDSETSECSSSNKSSKSRSPSPKKDLGRANRTYNGGDDYGHTDTETRSEGICLSGRGNEGQIFGIPVVFKAFSPTRSFWHIRNAEVTRDLEQIVGDNVVNLKINRAGLLCVNVATAADAVKLLNVTMLGGANVESVIPSMYLRHEAKIRGVPYQYTNEQLAAYFSDVGVVSARRQLTVKRLYDGSFQEYPRSSVILTFKPDATLPRILDLGADRFLVEEYIEAPFQCFKCLRFGHASRECVSVGRCNNCGARYCMEECEQKTPVCANCFGPHSATYVGCPRRREVAFASLWKNACDLNVL